MLDALINRSSQWCWLLMACS